MEDLKFIAQQLRKPSGDFAPAIAEKMNGANQPLYDLMLSKIDIKENDTILEIGFGNGNHFKELFSQYNNLKVYGIDYSKDMVEQATVRNLEFINSGKLILVEGSSDHLPFHDQIFDKVFCNMVIYFWDQPEDDLHEIYRVLKPNGYFYTGIRTKESMLGFQFTKYGFTLHSVDEWKSILEKCGFTVRDTYRKMDPVFQDNGKNYQLESVCIAAEKVV